MGCRCNICLLEDKVFPTKNNIYRKERIIKSYFAHWDIIQIFWGIVLIASSSALVVALVSLKVVLLCALIVLSGICFLLRCVRSSDNIWSFVPYCLHEWLTNNRTSPLDALTNLANSGWISFYVSRAFILLTYAPFTEDELLALLKGCHPIVLNLLTTRGLIHCCPKRFQDYYSRVWSPIPKMGSDQSLEANFFLKSKSIDQLSPTNSKYSSPLAVLENSSSCSPLPCDPVVEVNRLKNVFPTKINTCRNREQTFNLHCLFPSKTVSSSKTSVTTKCLSPESFESNVNTLYRSIEKQRKEACMPHNNHPTSTHAIDHSSELVCPQCINCTELRHSVSENNKKFGSTHKLKDAIYYINTDPLRKSCIEVVRNNAETRSRLNCFFPENYIHKSNQMSNKIYSSHLSHLHKVVATVTGKQDFSSWSSLQTVDSKSIKTNKNSFLKLKSNSEKISLTNNSSFSNFHDHQHQWLPLLFRFTLVRFLRLNCVNSFILSVKKKLLKVAIIMTIISLLQQTKTIKRVTKRFPSPLTMFSAIATIYLWVLFRFSESDKIFPHKKNINSSNASERSSIPLFFQLVKARQMTSKKKRVNPLKNDNRRGCELDNPGSSTAISNIESVKNALVTFCYRHFVFEKS